jgi:hypothetical protein
MMKTRKDVILAILTTFCLARAHALETRTINLTYGGYQAPPHIDCHGHGKMSLLAMAKASN